MSDAVGSNASEFASTRRVGDAAAAVIADRTLDRAWGYVWNGVW